MEMQTVKSYIRLNNMQLKDLAGLFHTVYRIKMEYNQEEIKKLYSCTGVMSNPVTGWYEYDRKMHIDICKYWTLPLMKEVE